MDEFDVHHAARDGDIEKLKHFIKEGMSVDSLDNDNYTPMHWAAKCGRLEVAEFLICQKANLDLKAKDASTAVLLAAENGHKSVVELLLRSGAYAGGSSKMGGWTLLHHAARSGWTDTVKCLLENKNNKLNQHLRLDDQTRLGMTPMMLAAFGEHTDVIELLLDAGANVKNTVLDFAVIKGWVPLVKKIVKLCKFCINWELENGVKALLLAAKYGHQEVVEILIEAGADVNVRDLQGRTVLHYAVNRGWLEIVTKVLKINTVDINAKNEEGNTALHIAYDMNNIKIVNELLKAGADASIRNKSYDTALFGKTIHDAAASGDMERLKYLINVGLSVETRNREGYTPLHSAAENNQLEVGKYLIHNSCNLNPKASNNLTPMFVAAFRDHAEFVALLIKHGADVNIFTGFDETTILHTACEKNWIDIIRSILEKKNAIIETKTLANISPLWCAVVYRYWDAAKLLLKAGANVHSCDNQGVTPLHLVCRGVIDVEMVRALLLAEADPNLKNTDGDTPFHLAIEQDEPCLEAITLLIQHGAYFSYSGNNNIYKNRPLREVVLNNVDLCTQLIINKFNRQSLPAVYKNPEYVEKLPRMNKMIIGTNSEGVVEGIAACVQSEIEAKSYCHIMKIRPTVLTLMCVEALINPKPIQTKRSCVQALNKFKGPVKRSARIASRNEGSSKKKCRN